MEPQANLSFVTMAILTVEKRWSVALTTGLALGNIRPALLATLIQIASQSSMASAAKELVKEESAAFIMTAKMIKCAKMDTALIATVARLGAQNTYATTDVPTGTVRTSALANMDVANTFTPNAPPAKLTMIASALTLVFVRMDSARRESALTTTTAKGRKFVNMACVSLVNAIQISSLTCVMIKSTSVERPVTVAAGMDNVLTRTRTAPIVKPTAIAQHLIKVSA